MITLVETPEDMQQLMRECIQVTYEWIDKANKHWHLSMPYYKIVFALKSGTAGKARLGEGVIQFNPTLLRENPVAFLARTPGHEVIHFANHKVHGPDVGAHGPEWKRMMVDMSLPPTRCHSYDTSNVPTNVFRRRRKPVIVAANVGQIKSFGLGKVIDFD
jgi:SprT protein